MVVGIALSFVAMGVVTSLFGAAVAPWLPRLEKLAVRWASGLLLLAFGAVILKKGMLFAGM